MRSRVAAALRLTGGRFFFFMTDRLGLRLARFAQKNSDKQDYCQLIYQQALTFARPWRIT
jgi:hypothetical protein